MNACAVTNILLIINHIAIMKFVKSAFGKMTQSVGEPDLQAELR
jgi:hypothetical protein